MDGGQTLGSRVSYVDLASETPHALSRTRVDEPLTFGVRALDTLVPCGKGQRLGIFAGSGVGAAGDLREKAGLPDADVRVIGLIGERGREVREFLEENLGEEGMARTVVVVATSDEHRVEAGDRAGHARAGLLQQLRHHREDARRVAPGGRGLAGREADLALGHGLSLIHI